MNSPTPAPADGGTAATASNDQGSARERTRQLAAELAETQVRLDRATARFRDVIERNPDAQIVVGADGLVRFANPAAAELFGVAQEELHGSHFGFPLVVRDTTEVDLLARGKSLTAEMRVLPTEWEGEDAYIASLRDVTERKLAELEARRLIRVEADYAAAETSARTLGVLLESTMLLSSSLDYQETLRTLAKLCTDQIADWTVIYGLDQKGDPQRLVVIHREPKLAALAEELSRIPIDPQTAHPVLDVVRSGKPSVVPLISAEELSRMRISARELEIARALGVRSWMLVPMIARGRALGAIAFVRADRAFTDQEAVFAQDLAHRAALAVDNALLYDEARRATRTKADLLTVVSHDLRTPLTAIMGYSDLLLLGIPQPLLDGQRDQVVRMQTAARHLLFLLNELIEFSRLDAGAVRIHLQPVRLADVVNEVAVVMEPLAAERGLNFRAESADGLTVETDPDRLRQILMNLVGNAVKYTPRGSVALETRRDGDSVVIYVRDTGQGIAPEHISRIFDPFWQVESPERRRPEGAGIGLSVVKRLAELLNARISVESEVGNGSTFTVKLPVHAQANPAPRPTTTPG